MKTTALFYERTPVCAIAVIYLAIFSVFYSLSQITERIEWIKRGNKKTFPFIVFYLRALFWHSNGLLSFILSSLCLLSRLCKIRSLLKFISFSGRRFSFNRSSNMIFFFLLVSSGYDIFLYYFSICVSLNSFMVILKTQ